VTVAHAVYQVTLEDEDTDNGVALVLSSLLSQNLEQHPSRVKIARRISRPVSVYDKDSDATATVVFSKDAASVHSDTVGCPSVVVKATVAQILEISQLKMKAGGLVPIGFFTRRGFRVLWDIGRRRLIVKGLLLHTVAVFRFIALVSIV
jgi:hypothetical protein